VLSRSIARAKQTSHELHPDVTHSPSSDHHRTAAVHGVCQGDEVGDRPDDLRYRLDGPEHARQENECGIRLEDLKGIRQSVRSSRSFRYSLNSWSFHQLQQMIGYKAKLLGIPVEYIAPEYTSQLCSRCGLIGDRNGKVFRCSNCGHVDNADVNASFNIALRLPSETMASMYRSNADRDVLEGSTDTPGEAMP